MYFCLVPYEHLNTFSSFYVLRTLELMLGFEKAESLCLTMEIVTDMFSKVLANTVHDKIMTTSTIIFDPKNTPVDFLAGYVVND